MAIEKRFHFPVGILIVVMLLGLSAAAIYIWKVSLNSKVDDLKTAIAYVQSRYAFARMKVLAKTGDSVTVRFSVLDLSGNVVGGTNFTLPGQDFFLESRVLIAELEDEERAFVFPIKVYSDTMAPAQGVSVEPLYMKDGMPMNYILSNTSPGLALAMKNLKQIAYGAVLYGGDVQDRFIKNAFDTAVHQNFMRPFQAGDEYDYVIHPNGGIELLESGYGNE